MKKILLLLICAITNYCVLLANYSPIVIQNGGAANDHNEHFSPADMPEVYFDSVNQEIVIVADGFSSYYDVEIVSQSSMQLVLSTQVDGYGDSIDISSLPYDNYMIVIISEFNNVYQGQFTNY